MNAKAAKTAKRMILCVLCVLCVQSFLLAQTAPVIVVDTVKGIFEIETYPADAPKTVAHVLDLVKSGFYDGQRIHRALPGFVVQWGDPRSRDTARAFEWGKGAAASSGKSIGAAEIAKQRTHMKGAVAVAHLGNPAQADSQMFVTLADRPDLTPAEIEWWIASTPSRIDNAAVVFADGKVGFVETVIPTRPMISTASAETGGNN